MTSKNNRSLSLAKYVTSRRLTTTYSRAFMIAIIALLSTVTVGKETDFLTGVYVSPRWWPHISSSSLSESVNNYLF